MIELPIKGGLRVAVPDSLDLITPYVLREQEDWFEDEIGFVRQVLSPGDKGLDIGANYGVYTLAMAAGVGKNGRIWAFEPASSTAAYLERSIALNAQSQVTLVQAALSNRVGTASLGLNANSEMNCLQNAHSPDVPSESVAVTTLDVVRQNLGIRGIDFVKLDAEGEEGRILEGGSAFLSEESPLIMYELKHGATTNLALIEQFGSCGYDSYRLVKGLDLLVPWEKHEQPDPYMLNLFCCKSDRAMQLREAGRLICLPADRTPAPSEDVLRDLRHFPYAARMNDTWKDTARRSPISQADPYREALGFFFTAHTRSHPAATRYQALHQSFLGLAAICRARPTLPRLLSFARVAQEIGQRMVAVNVLRSILSVQSKKQGLPLDEPFVPPSARFDELDPGSNVSHWVLASILETLERLEAYSSYYSGQNTLSRLDMLEATGFQSPEMCRRKALIREKFNLGPAKG